MRRALILLLIVMLALPGAGCHVTHPHHYAAHRARSVPVPQEMPRELAKVALPRYTVEPPDILVIEAVHIIPKDPYTLRTGDRISIDVPPSQTLPDAPITGTFVVQAGGVVNLGPPYQYVKVAGLTVESAQNKIRQDLMAHLTDENLVVSVSLIEMAGMQQIAGQHLVGPDGTVTLGTYGSVPVVGLTLAEAKQVIELHLSQFLDDPQISVDVYAYNSKVYYVITEGAGTGDAVQRFPITGNETVLDAISNVNGLTDHSSTTIWIARPCPETGEELVLPVDWRAVTATGAASSNYQILPGDRVFVAEDKRVALDTDLAKLLAPLERVMGFTLLTANTTTRLSGKVLKGGGNPQGGGFGT